MSAVAQMFLHLTFSCPALREAVVSPNLPSVLLEEEEEAEEEGRRRRRSSVAASDAVPEGRRLLTPRELNVVAQASPT